jgi:hypothetical protein
MGIHVILGHYGSAGKNAYDELSSEQTHMSGENN